MPRKSKTFNSISNQTEEQEMKKRDHNESDGADEDTSDSEKGYVTIRKRVLPFRASRSNRSNKKDIIEEIADIKVDKANSKSVKADSKAVSKTVVKTDSKSEITDSIPKKVLKSKKKSKILSKKKRKKRIKKPIKPVAMVNEFKLKKMLKSIDGKHGLNDSQMEFKKCVAQMHPAFEPLGIGRPYFIMKAINECLLNRDWDSLTHLVIELIHLKSDVFKPVVRHLCAIMDKLHPIIIENDLQGKFKTIKKYHQLIMDDTTVV